MTEKSSDAKAERILSIYSRLRQGKIIDKSEESIKYAVARRTIQRDIGEIQCFLQNQSSETGEIQEIVFDKKVGGYRLETRLQTQLTSQELLTVCKVMLESRSLIKDEMFPIINKLLNCCGKEDDRSLIKEYLGNEMHHYIELQHHKKLLEKIWELEQAVKEHKYLEIQYRKIKGNEIVTRRVKPVGVMFSEFYFYLTAYIDDIDKEIEFENPNDPFPTIYRVDRLENVKILDERFSIPYKERFEEGEFRKRIQFMYGGKLRRVQFKYTGQSVDFILDRLPTAQIIQKDESGIVIQAEVFGDGIDMWLRSQGEKIIVTEWGKSRE